VVLAEAMEGGGEEEEEKEEEGHRGALGRDTES
jgi:hypothetical protein